VTRLRYGWLAVLASFLVQGVALDAGQRTPFRPTGVTTVYVVKHGELDATGHLNQRGKQRAADLVRVLERVPLTHAFSSHTDRAFEAVQPTAANHGLTVTRLPALGSRGGDGVVISSSPSAIAVDPLGAAIAAVPAGSIVLVGVNRENVFGVIHRLGVPIGTSERPCQLGDSCVPCLTVSCSPEGSFDLDNMWILRIDRNSNSTELTWLTYGSR
jgi:hypothetical protein